MHSETENKTPEDNPQPERQETTGKPVINVSHAQTPPGSADTTTKAKDSQPDMSNNPPEKAQTHSDKPAEQPGTAAGDPAAAAEKLTERPAPHQRATSSPASKDDPDTLTEKPQSAGDQSAEQPETPAETSSAPADKVAQKDAAQPQATSQPLPPESGDSDDEPETIDIALSSTSTVLVDTVAARPPSTVQQDSKPEPPKQPEPQRSPEEEDDEEEQFGGTTRLEKEDVEEGEISWGTSRFTTGMHLILTEDSTKQMFAFDSRNVDKIVLGRVDPRTSARPDVDLTACNAIEKGVSRRHAAIEIKGNKLTITDLNSANKTYLNGFPMVEGQSRILRNGDNVALGNLVLRVSFVRR